MPNWVWWFILLAIVAGLLRVARRLDGGSRSGDDAEVFDCLVQPVDLEPNQPLRRWRPARAAFVDLGQLVLAERGAPRPWQERLSIGPDPLSVVGRSDAPPRGRSVYVVGEGNTLYAVSVTRDSPADKRLAITLPD